MLIIPKAFSGSLVVLQERLESYKKATAKQNQSKDKNTFQEG